MRLSTSLCCQGIFDPAMTPVCTSDELKQAAEHCILIAYGEGGAAFGALQEGNQEQVRDIYAGMARTFGPFEIAISASEQEEWKKTVSMLHQTAAELNLHTLALPKVMYQDREDSRLFDLVNAIRQDTTYDDMFLDKDNGCWLMKEEELKQYYDPEDLKRTTELASLCESYEQPSVSLPVFYHDEKGHTSETYLKELAEVGLQKRMEQTSVPKQQRNSYRQRLHNELDVICRMHFADYFLIVFDYVRYAKKNDIWTGPGRGSAVASLTAYAIGITDIDPMRYHLLFERFLNTGRRGMPDIDVDFAEEGRGRVIQYVQKRYGQKQTAGVVTVSCYKTKNLLTAVSKAMGLQTSKAMQKLYETVKNVYAMRENEGKSLQEIRPYVETFLQDPEVRECYEACEKLAGIPAQYGRHPSGVITSDRPVCEAEPLMKLDDGEGLQYFGQYEEPYLEERGLIKMDFLSLPSSRPLEEMIRKVKEDDPSFDIHRIDLNEPLLYQTFARGMTLGYFQFDARSMKKNILPRIQPENFNDLMVCNAIGRANLTQLVERYAWLKKHPDQAVYYAGELRPVLEETYGIMLYQEQVIMTAHIAADYTMAEADALRRGIKKKDQKALQANEKEYISRCMNHQPHHYSYQEARSLWQDILRFSSYGFNKSHSAAYTTIAVWEAYMKVRHTDLYYDCLLKFGRTRIRPEDAEQEKQAVRRLAGGR
jgi:DNA polymerase-3 subunit alpha